MDSPWFDCYCSYTLYTLASFERCPCYFCVGEHEYDTYY